MPEQHPITPPKQLINKWQAEGYHQDYCEAVDYLFHKIAEWGWEQRGTDIEAKLQKARDEELEAICEYIAGRGRWFVNPQYRLDELRAARRPKPPSPQEEALKDFDLLMSELDGAGNYSNCADRIRRALGYIKEEH